MKLYFAYGANLNKDSMRVRCPDAVPISEFRLQDYRLAFSGVATILPEQGSEVVGGLWVISETDELALDRFEGYPSMYRKEVVQQDGMDIMVYVMNSTEPWEPSANYLMTIAEGYQDFGLDIARLAQAVERTQQEIDYDMQWSTPTGIGLDTSLEEPLRDQFSHDIRWLRDLRLADRDIETIQ